MSYFKQGFRKKTTEPPIVFFSHEDSVNLGIKNAT